jgi:predicted metalloprotease
VRNEDQRTSKEKYLGSINRIARKYTIQHEKAEHVKRILKNRKKRVEQQQQQEKEEKKRKEERKKEKKRT